MNISNKTLIFGVIGNPISHTKSPELHNNWARENNLDLIYLPLLVDDLDAFITWFKGSNLLGFNVTIPFKEKIIPHIEILSNEVYKIGAVNTVFKNNGKLYGYNTDYIGIEKTLEPIISDKCSVLIIGSGGAAKSTIYYLNSKSITPNVVSRNTEALNLLNQKFKINISSFDNAHNYAEIIINCTPVGMINEDLPIDLEYINHKTKFVFDMIYEPESTPLLNYCIKKNIAHSNGYKMLVEQAKAAFKIWTDIYPD